MKKYCYILFLLFFISIVTYGKIDHVGDKKYWLPSVENSNEILLYDRFDQRIFTYDTTTFSVIEKNKELNYFQYEFNQPFLNIFTTGHSIKNNFKIIEIKDNNINTLYTMKENEAIFPLAYKDDNNIFFIKSYYDSENSEIKDLRVICKFNLETKQLIEIEETKGLMTSDGTIHNNCLYFTTYNIDKDNFTLYKIDLFNNKLSFILDDLKKSDIYNNGNELWLSDEEFIYSGDKKFDKKRFNYFYEGKLIQIELNDKNSLSIYITDIQNEELEHYFDEIVDFRINDRIITIYGNQFIKEIEI